jgi:hypothetical protein
MVVFLLEDSLLSAYGYHSEALNVISQLHETEMDDLTVIKFKQSINEAVAFENLESSKRIDIEL